MAGDGVLQRSKVSNIIELFYEDQKLAYHINLCSLTVPWS